MYLAVRGDIFAMSTTKKRATIYVHVCNICHYRWESRKANPRLCSKCKGERWNK